MINSQSKDIDCQIFLLRTACKKTCQKTIKTRSDLTLKIGQTDTWGNKNRGFSLPSWGEYESMIRAHDEKLGAFGKRPKWATHICKTGNNGKKVIFANEMDLGKCANKFIKTWKLTHLNNF